MSKDLRKAVSKPVVKVDSIARAVQLVLKRHFEAATWGCTPESVFTDIWKKVVQVKAEADQAAIKSLMEKAKFWCDGIIVTRAFLQSWTNCKRALAKNKDSKTAAQAETIRDFQAFVMHPSVEVKVYPTLELYFLKAAFLSAAPTEAGASILEKRAAALKAAGVVELATKLEVRQQDLGLDAHMCISAWCSQLFMSAMLMIFNYTVE